ncbi:ABC transporter permease [Parachitinimonas caeni]|uniref:ABC transporter permease n=1 Tax=Parachitinimonas caeni TaxID=3031301 RepID=A0ABT7E2R7_9NEIS|nr:ABC transporter permease [Parachitinimonas caeni]MDK2126604.1 ABC transporter permease [Parachitinimonas caeni]
MNIVKLAYKQLATRPLHTILNVLLLALGIATITLLMLFNAQLQDKLLNSSKGIDLVVGAKGSPLQLILSSVYHADIPNGNIPLKEADQIAKHRLVAKAIPMALGDNLMGFRIVGTTHDYVGLYGGEIAEGQLWKVSMEAVLGANVAKKSGLKVGQNFAGSHGLAGNGGHEHDDNQYHVVGILKPTGTVLDDVVLTEMQSVWDLHESETTTNPVFAQPSKPATAAKPANDDDDEEEGKPRDITALLISYKTPLAVLALPRHINANTNMLAASPAMEAARLLSIVGFGLDAFRAFAAILIISAGLSVFVALYTALKERRFDLAVMRMLGSSRFRLFTAVLLEGLLLAVASAALGLAIGHGVVELAGRTGMTPGLALTGRYWVPQEALLALLAVGVGAFAALIPAIQAYRTEIATVLSER